jgi:hypothetical protein
MFDPSSCRLQFVSAVGEEASDGLGSNTVLESAM